MIYEGNEVDSSWCTSDGRSNLQRTACGTPKYSLPEHLPWKQRYLSVVAEKKIILIIQVRLESFELYQDSQQRIGKFRLSCGWFISYNPTGAKVHRCRFTVSSGTMWWPYMRKNDSAPSHVIKNWFGENFCGCANSISFPEFDALN